MRNTHANVQQWRKPKSECKKRKRSLRQKKPIKKSRRRKGKREKESWRSVQHKQEGMHRRVCKGFSGWRRKVSIDCLAHKQKYFGVGRMSM